MTVVPPTADHVKPKAAPSVAQMSATAIKPRLQYFPRLPSKQVMLSISFAAGEKQVAGCEAKRFSVYKTQVYSKIFHVCKLTSTTRSKTGKRGVVNVPLRCAAGRTAGAGGGVG